MSETQKPFFCVRKGCNLTFTNEDHLNVHTKKHDMALHLGLDTESNVVVADQTPTPTRFIRNCEEVGLFQDLQNVNPFDETFRKATELVKNGSLHVSESQSTDTLHTPHIFPHTEEENGTCKFTRNISSEPEFAITTIDFNLHSSDEDSESKDNLDIEILSLTDSEPEAFDKESLESPNNSTINCNLTVISKDSLIGNNSSNTIPVLNSPGCTELLPAIVHNLSDIEINVSECKDITKSKSPLISLKNRVDNEREIVENSNDICNNQETICSSRDTVIQRIKNTSVLVNNINICTAKIPQKRVFFENSSKNTPNNKQRKCSNIGTVVQSRNTNLQTTLPGISIELQRQREINRAAQVRSREKKKYWITQMESEIKLLKEEKKVMWAENQNLKNEILWLKTMLLYHKDCPVAQDPKTKREINMLVKKTQEHRKKMENNVVPSKKMPTIVPNPTNVIAVTHVPTSVVAQLPSPTLNQVLSPLKQIPAAVESQNKVLSTSLSTVTSNHLTSANNVLTPLTIMSNTFQSSSSDNPGNLLHSAPKIVYMYQNNPSLENYKTAEPKRLPIKSTSKVSIRNRKNKKLHIIKSYSHTNNFSNKSSIDTHVIQTENKEVYTDTYENR